MIPADKNQISRFAKSLFRYAVPGTHVSLRAFREKENGVFEIESVEIDNTLDNVVAKASDMAQRCAEADTATVFCPPIATFKAAGKADEANLANGLALSIECDQSPNAALQALEPFFGPPTMVVASGGEWLNLATGEIEAKLHLHWRLKQPTTTPQEHATLKRVRALATAYVEGDASNKPIVHPIRWPGSVHLKATPRLAQIVSETENELELSYAAEVFSGAQETSGDSPHDVRKEADSKYFDEKCSTTDLIAEITSGSDYHAPITALAMRYLLGGMPDAQVVLTLRGFMQAVPVSVRDIKNGTKIPGRWQTRYNDIPRAVSTARIKIGDISAGEMESRVELVRGDTITPEPVEWLWQYWLARGKIHILGGLAGTGKTTIALRLAATITKGSKWPDGEQSPQGNIVIWSGEDDPTDTLIPRLIAAGANISNVYFVSTVAGGEGKRPFDPARDMATLRAEIQRIGNVLLLIVDPVVSAVAGDSHKNAETRRSLQPLVDLAAATRCAVLGITHFTKGTAGREPLERITGSLAFGALPRVVLVAAKGKELTGGQPTPRLLLRAKANNGPDDGGFGYDLKQSKLIEYPDIIASVAVWGAKIEGSAREILAQAEAQNESDVSALEEAKDFLCDLLLSGPLPVTEISKQYRNAGHTKKTIERAKKSLGIKAIKDGMKGGWLWQLFPKIANDTEDGQQKYMGTFGENGSLQE